MTEWTCKTNDKMDINSITHAHTPQMDGGEIAEGGDTENAFSVFHIYTYIHTHTPQMDGGEVAEGGDTENAVEQVQCSLADVLTRQVPRSLLRVH